MKIHIAILGLIHLVSGLLVMLAGVAVAVFGVGASLVSLLHLESGGMLAGLLLGGGLGGIIAAFGVPGVVTGYGLLMCRAWGRIFGIISAVLSLAGWPVGTILGVYGLWVLLSANGAREFNR
jgi:hypothetical protein